MKSASTLSHFKHRGMVAIFSLIVVGFLLISIGGCNQNASKEPIVLKVAMARVGENTQKIWYKIADDFQAVHPGVKINYLGMNDRHYETSGLTSLLLYENPDIFFEWGGERVAVRQKDGYAYDLTDEVKSPFWKNRFASVSWSGMKVNDRVYMIPYASQISNVFWYNKAIFDRYNLAAPETWKEFETVCEKLKSENITPLYLGNKDLWPGGNLMGHVVSRIVGEQAYHDALKGKRNFNESDFLKAFQFIDSMRVKGYFNTDLNGLSSDEGTFGWMKGKGAMHALGSWVVELEAENAPEGFQYDFFHLPAIEGKKGDQSSILGLNIGFIINNKSSHKKKAIEFLKFISEPERSAQFTSDGEMVAVKGDYHQYMNPLTFKLQQSLNRTDTIVAPPDTGYDLNRAEAFYRAVSKVSGGVLSPEQSLKELDASL